MFVVTIMLVMPQLLAVAVTCLLMLVVVLRCHHSPLPLRCQGRDADRAIMVSLHVSKTVREKNYTWPPRWRGDDSSAKV